MAKGRVIRNIVFRVSLPIIAFLVCMVISPVYTWGTLMFSSVVEFGLKLVMALYLGFLSWSTGDHLGGIWDKDRLPRYARVIPRPFYSAMGVVFGIPWFIIMVVGLSAININIAFFLFPMIDSWIWFLSGIGIAVAYMLVLGVALVRLLYSIQKDVDWELR